MAENILEKADEQVAEAIRKLSGATSAMAEAIDEGAGAIKLAVKRSGDLAEELMDDTMQRVKRHPWRRYSRWASSSAGSSAGWCREGRRCAREMLAGFDNRRCLRRLPYLGRKAKCPGCERPRKRVCRPDRRCRP